MVYFQFDADRMVAGDHVGRPGYFDYRRDGFGPVAESTDAAVRAIVETVRTGRRPAEPYAARIARTFPDRDGRCCKRITDAVLASTRKRPARPAPESTPRRAIAAATRSGLAELAADHDPTTQPSAR